MAKYPDEIFEPREKEDRAGVVYDPTKKTVIFAEDIKALDDEVKAIETELGTNPRGTFDSVKAFLQYLLGKVKDYFTDLLDVPHSYEGQAGKVLKVKQTEDGLEFGTAPPPGPHASTHEEGGSDAINPANIGADWNKLVNKPSTFPPNTHASSHQEGGSDVINVEGLSGVLADYQKAKNLQSGLDANKPSSPSVGDVYIATDTGKIYKCISAGEWVLAAALKFTELSDVPSSYTGHAGKSVRVNSGENSLEFWDDTITAITFIIDGGGSAITTGQKGHLEIPFDCEIQRVTLLADQVGSIVIDIWKDTYANFPPTSADSICGGNKPTISSAQKYQDSTLTGWTKTINAGDILAFNVDSVSTITRLTIALKVKKT
jgi:hypothetical protein